LDFDIDHKKYLTIFSGFYMIINGPTSKKSTPIGGWQEQHKMENRYDAGAVGAIVGAIVEAEEADLKAC
jgi:hypothetical protein